MHRQILNKTASVESVNIFYREAGDHNNPSILLLHGFPTSSLMFKNLMASLSDNVSPESWIKYDPFFDIKEAYCYQNDLPNVETYILEGGHMALETNFDEVARLIDTFLSK